MSIANIVLWTTSLTLTIFSIIFAAVAAYFSNKSSNQIRETLSAEWIVTTSNKFFFDQMKSIKLANTRIINKLKTPISYSSYSSEASNTRFAIISSESKKILKDSIYSELTKSYVEFKQQLQKEFVEVVKLNALSSTEEIPADVRKQLIEYHKRVRLATQKILSDFVVISSGGSSVV